MSPSSPFPSVQPSPAQTVLRMANAFHTSQAIHVAAQLGLADFLADGPLAVAALSEAMHVHPPSLLRLLRMLVSLGVLSEDVQGRFALTEIGAALQSAQTGSVREAVRFLTSEWLWRAWGELSYSVQTGKPAFDHVWGMSNFDYWEHDSEAGRIHDGGMAEVTTQQIPAIVAAYDYSRFKTIIDVGGGQGALLAAILQAYPAAQGILFDLPQVVGRAADVLARAGVADRCAIVAGSFFESAPGGGDAYLLKYILHDWDDERALSILKVCHQAMPRHGTLLIIDRVLPGTTEPTPEMQNMLGTDLQMLILTPGGRERTAAEFRALATAAGFEFRSIYRTQSVVSIVECVCA